MGKFAFLAVAAWLPCLCSAAPCVSGTLSSYIGLGGAGCTIGTNTLFDFRMLPGTAGGSEIAALNVLLAPLGGAFDPGLVTTVSATAMSGSVLETLFTYKITGGFYTSSSIALANSSVTRDGGVTGIENLCIGGTFGGSGTTGCIGVATSLLTAAGVQNQDSKTFSPASLLSVTNDLTIDGGIAGSASGGMLTNRFTAVPEPTTALFTLIGLTLAAAARKKLTNSRS